MSAPTDAGGALSEAAERLLLDEAVTACAWAEKALERYDNALGLDVDEAALIALDKLERALSSQTEGR